MKDLKNKNLVLAAIAREMNFWYDVSLKTDSNITKEEAENKIISMIDEHEITKKAYEQKAEIIDSANAFSKDLIDGTKKYADEILAELEANLQDKLAVIKENRSELR